ncbi:MAG: type secretion protein [Rhodoferax sp.]|nr:type secretion protein [Rhodoferax sp.]
MARERKSKSQPGSGPDRTAQASGLPNVLVRLRQAPWKFGFTVLMRRFGAAYRQQPRIGLARRPQQEAFRLGQRAALSFAPREIAEVVLAGESLRTAASTGDDPSGESTSAPSASSLALPSQSLQPPAQVARGRGGNNPTLPMVRLYGLGMLGPNGPLPLHYTEWVRERTENFNDSTLADFLDVFHHRYLTHMYRAWAQAQAAAGLDRADDETFSRYIAQLTGHDPLEIRDSVLPSHARMAASTHLGREARNPDGLAQTLGRFFSVPVQLQEFVMHWIRIDTEDQTRLGTPRTSSMLGVGAMLGEVVADRQNKFRLVLGPLPMAQYLRFTPMGKDLPLLVEWVRGFVGYEFVWEVELRVSHESAPPARLGDTQSLGWSTWLGGAGGAVNDAEVSFAGDVPDARRGSRADPDQHGQLRHAPIERVDYAIGMVFKPELYVGKTGHGHPAAAPA